MWRKFPNNEKITVNGAMIDSSSDPRRACSARRRRCLRCCSVVSVVVVIIVIGDGGSGFAVSFDASASTCCSPLHPSSPRHSSICPSTCAASVRSVVSSPSMRSIAFTSSVMVCAAEAANESDESQNILGSNKYTHRKQCEFIY